MGQTIGKAPIQSEVLVFLNLPRDNIIDLWEAFNDIAEGFGLTLNEVQDILRVALKEYLGCSDKRINALSEALFHLFDDDRNGLVDSLEFLSAFCVISGMSVEEKVGYIFGIYDFEGSGVLTVDEMTLALRATMSGLRKVSGIDPPHVTEIDKIALGPFKSKAAVDDDPLQGNKINTTVTKEQVIDYAFNCPEMSSWLQYFGDFDEVELKEMPSQNSIIARRLDLSRQANNPRNIMDHGQKTYPWRGVDEKGQSKKVNSIVQPWRQQIPFSEPKTDYSNVDTTSMPNSSLELEWVHGRNTETNGNSAFYTTKGNIVYPAGSIGVKFCRNGKEDSSQEYFMRHTDYITCLTVFHDDAGRDTLVATGQRGSRPKITVWSANKVHCLVSIVGFHRVGVSNLDFSPSGNLLVSVGMDEMSSIAVYDWREQKAIFTSLCHSQMVWDCRFLGSEDYFGVCGDHFVHFWKRRNEGEIFHRQRGLFGRTTPTQTMTCIAHMNRCILTGASTGDLCLWQGRSCIRVLKAPSSGSITSIHVSPSNENFTGGLCAGTSDGRLHMWNEKLELWASYSISSYGGLSRYVNTVCWDPPSSRILVGLESSDLLEVNDVDGSIIGKVMNGHYFSGVWGLSAHPFKNEEVVTVGYDKTVRIWCANTHTSLRMVTLDTPATCVSYSHDGNHIAVGLGCSKDGEEERKEGAFMILRTIDLSIIYQSRDSKKSLTDCKYSKDGKYLAFGSQDHCIYIYDTNEFAFLAKAKGHSSAITHIDFGCEQGNKSSPCLQSNSENGEIMFWTIKGKKLTPRSQRDTEWETQTCTLSWSLKGAHTHDDNGIMLQACCRTNKGESIATVDNVGRVCLHRFPVIQDEHFVSVYRGHSALIGDVKFSCGDLWCFTTGAEDSCLFQWRHRLDNVQASISNDNLNNTSDLFDMDNHSGGKRSVAWEIANNNAMDYVFAFEEDTKKEESDPPTRPWLRTIVAPSQPLNNDLSQPLSNISLEWIFGYSAARCGNNLFCCHDGDIIYNVGRTLVKRNTTKKEQMFYQEAKDEITSIALHPTKDVCAIGQMGLVPSINILKYASMETIQVISGHHRQAIAVLKFDPSGRNLVSLGRDSCQTMVIYDWENGSVVASSQTCNKTTLDVDFQRDGKGLVQCGCDFIYFWTMENDSLISHNAYFGEKERVQSFFSIGWDGNQPVIGTSDGHLYRFFGRKLDCSVLAHTSTIHSICSTNQGIATGSSDGLVKIWGPSLECKLSIDMTSLGSLRPEVKSVCWDNDSNRVLVGTAGNEIWELSGKDGSNIQRDGPLEQGHFESISSGLSIDPKSLHIATVGDDKTLRIWDVLEHKLIKSTEIEMASRACEFSPDGQMIAIGFGTIKKENAKQFNGKWIIMKENDFSVLYETRDSRKFITEIKWAASGEYIAVGSWDNKIYVYDVDMENKAALQVSLSSVIEQHNSHITSMDFSVDGKYLQATCGAYELKFYEAGTGLHIPAASRLKDVIWESQTCTLGWPIKGIWSYYNDECEVVTVHTCLRSDTDRAVVVSGDNFGQLKLFRYPCLTMGAQFRSFRAHCGPIAKARWVTGDSHLVTLGELDQAVMIWKHDIDDEAIEDKLLETRTMQLDGDMHSCESGDSEWGCAIKENDKNTIQEENESDSLSRPWVASMVEPRKPPHEMDPNRPLGKLELDYAHGLQAQYPRSAIVYNSHGNIVFSTSKLGVIYDRGEHNQRFYRKHQHKISTITVSPNGRFAASGEIALRPKVHVWDAQTGAQIIVLSEFHRKGIVCVAFSFDVKKIVSIGADSDNSISIWISHSGEWHDGMMLSSAKGGIKEVFFAQFTAFGHCQNFLVSGGKDHINFWSEKEGRLNLSKGIFNSVGDVQTMLCGASVGTKFITGTSSGCLYVWEERKLEKVIKAHQQTVNCIQSFECGFVTGGDDGCITLWSRNIHQIISFDLFDANVTSLCRKVRSVDVTLNTTNETAAKILVGTEGSEIYEVSTQTGDISLLHEGHFEGDTWGLAFHPTDSDKFVTCGDDGTVRIWSVSLRKVLRKAKMDCSIRAITWSNDGNELLVGCGGNRSGKRGKKDGVFMILDATTMQLKLEGRDTRHWITEAKYSPDSKTLAIAAMDKKIYIYENNKEMQHRLRCVIDNHNARIASLDFSKDSYLLQSSSIDHEQLCHNMDDGERLSLPSQIKNIDWNSYSSTYGWNVQGIWPTVQDSVAQGAPVCAQCSNDKSLLAVGNDVGEIKLFNFPIISKTASCQREVCHIGHVAKCQFSCDGETLVTVGKTDRAVLVWKVKKTFSDGHRGNE